MVRLAPRWIGLLSGLFAAALLAGCTVKRVGNPEPAREPTGKPYDFQGESASPPPPAVPAESAGAAAQPPPNLDTQQAASFGEPALQVQDLPAASAPVSAGSAPAPAPAPSAGDAGAAAYRVQIFASPDADAAERVRAEIQARFGVPASVTFQSPYYKVRAGDCPTNDACRELQEKLRSAGYSTVWIVQDQAR